MIDFGSCLAIDLSKLPQHDSSQEVRACVAQTMCTKTDEDAHKCVTCFGSNEIEQVRFFGFCWCMQKPPMLDMSK